MKSLNLRVALILITIGMVLLPIAATPFQGGIIRTLTAAGCAQVYAQARQTAAVQFFEFFFFGLALMSLGAFPMIIGRNQHPYPPTSNPLASKTVLRRETSAHALAASQTSRCYTTVES